VAIGSVVYQVQDGRERVVAYLWPISKAERKYCVTCRELLTTVKPLEHLHKYLYGQEFQLHTDNSALTWLLSFRNLEGHTTVWVQRLLEDNFTSEGRQGMKHTNADALSRRSYTKDCRKVEQRAAGSRERIVAAAAANGWDRQALIRLKLAETLRH